MPGDGSVDASSTKVDSSSEFALLLQLDLGSNSIVMAAEVDCCADPGKAAAAAAAGEGSSLVPADFMELKTIKYGRSELVGHPNP